MLYLISDRADALINIKKCLDATKTEYAVVDFFDSCCDSWEWISVTEFCENYKDETVVFAGSSDEISGEIRNLLKELGVSEYKILDFVKVSNAVLPPLRADRRLLALNGVHPEGIILGISHALAGIKTKYMKSSWLNLAMWSQDIFYNKCVLRYMLEKYRPRFDKLKYIVFDMFDYSYFNYDTSMSLNIPTYIENGGYSDNPHHYAENSNFADEYDWESFVEGIRLLKLQDISDDNLDVWDTYFKDYHSITGFTDIEDKCITEFASDERLKYQYGGLMRHAFSSTVQENIQLFDELLTVIESFNPEIKVYLIVMPRYYGVYETDQNDSDVMTWKERFYNIIEKLGDSHDFELIDFNGCDMSINRKNYMEAGHFNVFGAYRFTKLLEDIIYNGL